MFSSAHLFSQKPISGEIRDDRGKALSDWTITNNKSGEQVTSDNNGKFQIIPKLHDNLAFRKGNSTLDDFIIDSAEYALGTFMYSSEVVTDDQNNLKSQNAGSAISPKSYWLGSTLSYNIIGNSTEDVVGSAKVVLNPLKKKWIGGEWGILGNFANFQGNFNKDDIDKSIRKIVQSAQGLSLGLGSVWNLGKTVEQKDKTEKFISSPFNIHFSTAGRLNSFTNVGTDSATEDLLQLRNTLGLEYEGGDWGNGGKLNISIEGSCSFFGQSKYQKIFNEQKKVIFAVKNSIILPLAEKIGVLINSTFTPGEKPIFLFGLIFKNQKYHSDE